MSFTRRPRRGPRKATSANRRPGGRLCREPARAFGASESAGRLSRLSSILDALDQGIAFVSPQGTVVEANDRCLALVAGARESVLGRGIDVLDLETEDYQASAFLDLFRRGAAHAPVSFDRRFGYRDVTVKLQPVFDGAAFTGLVVSFIDVTPMVEARLSVERERSFLEQVITIAGAAICIVNRDDEVLTVNDEFTAITGYERDQALGCKRSALLRESPPSPGRHGRAPEPFAHHDPRRPPPHHPQERRAPARRPGPRHRRHRILHRRLGPHPGQSPAA
jgi:PAS domain S-box-containing protein